MSCAPRQPQVPRMIVTTLLCRYPFDLGDELELVEVEVGSFYGETALEAHERLARMFTAVENALVLDRNRLAWPVSRGTLFAFWTREVHSSLTRS